MKYTEYKYIYPPRPSQTTQPSELSKYDNGQFIAQPKYNGTCCVAFISKDSIKIMNRHNRPITSNYSQIDFSGLHSGDGWMVLCGEFLNKNKLGEDGKPFNLKFVIWDILVYDGDYMIGYCYKCGMGYMVWNILNQLDEFIIRDSDLEHINENRIK
jgi:ATP-dependent DNA ligase